MKNRWDGRSVRSSYFYSPRRQSRWVLADCDGKNLWNEWVLSLEWNSDCVMDGGSGEQVGDELVWHHQQSAMRHLVSESTSTSLTSIPVSAGMNDRLIA